MTDLANYSDLNFLIADDKAFIRNIIQSMLRRCRAGSISHANSGRDALRILKESKGRINCLISDWNMEPIDGLELLQIIRTGGVKGTPRDLCVLMVSGHSRSPLVKAALELDVNGFLVKPVAIDKMTATIDQAKVKTWTPKKVEAYQDVDLFDIPDNLKDPERLNPVWVLWPKRPQGVDVVADKLARVHEEAAASLADPSPPLVFKNKRRRPLEYVPPGLRLAEDIVTADGAMLLSAGVILTEKLLARLRDLADESEHRAYITVGDLA